MSRRRLASLFLVLLLGGCAAAAGLPGPLPEPARAPALRFGLDTFAFPNESRTRNRGRPDLFANYCFVMTRGVVQFHRFARFDPDRPRADAATYTALVREVVTRSVWREPLPPGERVVIPGYASLHEFSRVEEAAVKAGLVGRFWTWIHPTNWRVVFPFGGEHQARVAAQAVEELRAGRPVQLLVTNFPTIELNHSLVAYAYRPGADGDLEFLVYDPNDPRQPGLVAFERRARRFVAVRLYDTTPGTIRAFRMYYRALL